MRESWRTRHGISNFWRLNMAFPKEPEKESLIHCCELWQQIHLVWDEILKSVLKFELLLLLDSCFYSDLKKKKVSRSSVQCFKKYKYCPQQTTPSVNVTFRKRSFCIRRRWTLNLCKFKCLMQKLCKQAAWTKERITASKICRILWDLSSSATTIWGRGTWRWECEMVHFYLTVQHKSLQHQRTEVNEAARRHKADERGTE